MKAIPVATLVAISLDCADPQELADFYRALLGGRQLWVKEPSVGVEVPGGVLVAQKIDPYVRPVWPGTSVVHLDLTSDDLGAVADRAIELGATLPEQKDARWRVVLDPAGHPLCLTPFGVPPGTVRDQPPSPGPRSSAASAIE